MAVNLLERVEEKLTHIIMQVGSTDVPVFGKFSVIWMVQQKC